MDGTTLRIPATYTPRDYQKPLYRYLRNGGRRAVAVWHRRAGKDTTALEWTKEAALTRPGMYWHMLPTNVQARRVIWDGIDKAGNRLLDHFPGWRNPGTGIVQHIRHDEMKIELAGGSTWQCVGSDSYDSLVGSNPMGIVASEYSIADPSFWGFIRPILLENDGWFLAIYTPRGHNHGYTLYQNAVENENWFAELLTADATGVFTPEQLEEERLEIVKEKGLEEGNAFFQQEYFCSFEASLPGAFYGGEMAKMFEEARITHVPHQPGLPVETWWDLGIGKTVGESMSIGFVQRSGFEIHAIDYLECSGRGIPQIVVDLQQKQQKNGYIYGDFVWPHDGGHMQLASGETLDQTFKNAMGVLPKVLERADIGPGIDAVRRMLPKMYFDAENCDKWLNALRAYRRDFDEKNKVFKQSPLHDWSSHAADMTRMGAMHLPTTGYKPVKFPPRPDIV
jgi:phage terminase large subunit